METEGMTSINVTINIIDSSQAIPIRASMADIDTQRRGNFREKVIREYTTCANVVFIPVHIQKQGK
jgi:hypothetical protein